MLLALTRLHPCVDGWLYDLRGKEVVLTGDHPRLTREALTDLALTLGASRVHGWVNKKTADVLIRCGDSESYKYGTFGRKEAQVAQLQDEGHHVSLIDVEGLLALHKGLPAPTLVPNRPDVPPVRRRADEGGRAGAPYRAGRHLEPFQSDGDVFRDPTAVERGLRAHSRTQDDLAELVELVGYEPLSPVELALNFDLAWHVLDGTVYVAEIKSNTIANEHSQVRHGLGQVLDYAFLLEARGFRLQPLLVLEVAPEMPGRWLGLFEKHGVILTWGPTFNGAVR